MSGASADDALLNLLKDDQQPKQRINEVQPAYKETKNEEFLHHPQDNVSDGKNVQLTFFQNTEASLAKKIDPVLTQLEETKKQLEEQKKLNQKLQNNIKTLKKSFEAVINDQQEQIQSQQKQIDELQDLVTQTLEMTIEQQKQQGELKDEYKSNIQEIQNKLLQLQVDNVKDINESQPSEKSGLSNSKIIEDLIKRTVEQEINTKMKDIPISNKESDEYLFKEANAGSVQEIHQKVNEIVEERLKKFIEDENKKIEEIVNTQITERLCNSTSHAQGTHEHQCVLQQNDTNIQQRRARGIEHMHFSLDNQSMEVQQNKIFGDENIDFAAEQLSYKAQHRDNNSLQRTHNRDNLEISLNTRKYKPDYAFIAQYQLKNLEKSFRLAQK